MIDDRLNFPFDPTPSWVQTEHEAGRLSPERRDIVLAIVHRANVRRLRRGEPTPELRVESLALATHRPTHRAGLDALRRLLRDMRRDGDLDYATRGTGSRVIYEFTLTLTRSGVVPPSNGMTVPPSDTTGAVVPTGIAATVTADRSGVLDTAHGDIVPPEPVAVPPSNTPSKPLSEPDPAERSRALAPPSLDVQENPSTAWTEREASARAHEETPDEEALMDEFWNSTAKSGRGAYWEPDS